MIEIFTPFGVGSEYSCSRSGCRAGHFLVIGKLDRSVMAKRSWSVPTGPGGADCSSADMAPPSARARQEALWQVRSQEEQNIRCGSQPTLTTPLTTQRRSPCLRIFCRATGG